MILIPQVPMVRGKGRTFIGVTTDREGTFPVFVEACGAYSTPDPDDKGRWCSAMLGGRWARGERPDPFSK